MLWPSLYLPCSVAVLTISGITVKLSPFLLLHVVDKFLFIYLIFYFLTFILYWSKAD